MLTFSATNKVTEVVQLCSLCSYNASASFLQSVIDVMVLQCCLYLLGSVFVNRHDLFD